MSNTERLDDGVPIVTAPMLARLRKLYDAAQYDAAQPGPWRAHAVGGHGYFVCDHGDVMIAMAEIDSGEVDAATGALIAEMRNALPALLAVAEAAESVRDDYDDSELWDQPISVRVVCAAVDALRKGGA